MFIAVKIKQTLAEDQMNETNVLLNSTSFYMILNILAYTN